MPPIIESLLAHALFSSRLLSTGQVARAVGRATSARLAPSLLAPIIDGYTRAFDVDLAEAEVPNGGFESFDAFFARRLRDGARPIDDSPDVFVSPSDGALVDAGPIDGSETLTIKGQTYRAGELLAREGEVADFDGGTFAVIYLSPRDYHRVHVPCDASVELVRHVPGALFPVNAFGLRHVPKLFARNERVVIGLRSEVFGRVAVVMVGAGIVGRIDLAIPAPPRPPLDGEVVERRFAPDAAPQLRKGGELGAFILGSTVVVLVERNDKLTLAHEKESSIRVGRALFRA